MERIESDIGLRNAIIQMEIKHADEGKELRDQTILAWGSINPINIIKSVLTNTTESHSISGSLINSSLGLTAGYVSKLLFQALTKGPFTKQVGTAIMFGIAKVVSKNPEAIKTIGNIVLRIVLRKNSRKTS